MLFDDSIYTGAISPLHLPHSKITSRAFDHWVFSIIDCHQSREEKRVVLNMTSNIEKTLVSTRAAGLNAYRHLTRL